MQDFVLPTPRSRIALTLFYLAALVWLITAEAYLAPIAQEVTTLAYCDSLPYVRGELIYFGCLAAAVALPSYWMAFQIFRAGQTPLPGAYVFFKREVRRGWWAKLAGLGWLTLAVGVTAGCLYLLMTLPIYQLFNYERYSGCP